MRSIHSQDRAKRLTLGPVECLYRAGGLFSAALLTSLVCIGATPAAGATCASLAGLVLPDTTITVAVPVAAGPYTVAAVLWQEDVPDMRIAVEDRHVAVRVISGI
jgi:hypothetical protein